MKASRGGSFRAGKFLAGIYFAAALLLGLAAGARAGLPMAGGDNHIRRNLVSGGGAVSSGGGYSLNCALAETAVATSAAAGFGLYSGLAPTAAQPGSVIAITAVSKDTGTLELAWLAPGRDGFEGAVNGGFYRIDTSSDAAHVFDPTVFVTEFSTSAVPHEAQSYTLTGLQPNTTYYTRVYLADSYKVTAERSAPADEATLANLPVSPVLSGVFASSVTFTWALPEGGAGGYRLYGSTTNFGALFPGGAVLSSGTPQGTLLTLTIKGLYPDTTYFFKLGSLNWQQDFNFDTIVATKTLAGMPPQPITNLAALRDALGRRLAFSWTNPEYDEPDGVLVQVSTSPITYPLQAGTSYYDGGVFPDGSTVLAAAAGSSQLHEGLALNSTYYYRFSSQNLARAYSVFVATECILDLPPMAPAGLQASVNAARSQITLAWAGVTSNMDGSPFRGGGEPMELARYDVYRATGITRAAWTLVASVPATAGTVTVPVPDPAAEYYYRIAAADTVGEPGSSMVVDTHRNLYALAPDQVSRLKIPVDMAGVVMPGGNPSGKPLFFAARDNAADEGGKIMKSVEFRPVQAPTGAELAGFRLDSPEMDIVLRYDTEDGRVIPSSFKGSGIAPQAALASSVRASEAPAGLGVYWFNGREYVKVFGDVNQDEQTITVRSAMPGSYQIRSLARASGVNFGVREMSNKAITPNGDGRNDYVVFTLDNPGDAAVSGRIYNLSGAAVAEMRPGTQVADTLEWDGKSGGVAVPRGVYVYQIKADGKTFSGTIVVIR